MNRLGTWDGAQRRVGQGPLHPGAAALPSVPRLLQLAPACSMVTGAGKQGRDKAKQSEIRSGRDVKVQATLPVEEHAGRSGKDAPAAKTLPLDGR